MEPRPESEMASEASVRQIASAVVFLGPPGAGKGTQAAALVERLEFTHVNSGELLRHEVTLGTEIGRAVGAAMNRGEMVPDEIVAELLSGRLAQSGGERLIIDGFPKTWGQAELLEEHLSLYGISLRLAVAFQVDDETLRRRLMDRAMTHGREDDHPAAISRRLASYRAQQDGVESFYRIRGILRSVDGRASVPEVHDTIAEIVSPVL